MKSPESLKSLLPFLENEVFDSLPHALTYHNLAHTKQVIDFAMTLAGNASLSEKDTRLIYASAALHDSGYGKKYYANEGVAALLAARVLPTYNFTTKEIEQIQNMILATNLAIVPTNKLEMLLVDADLAYLGTDDFFDWSNKLYVEWGNMGIYDEPKEKWLASQIVFLEKHFYYTKEAQILFEESKQLNLQKLESFTHWPY